MPLESSTHVVTRRSSKEPHTYNLTHVWKVVLHFHVRKFNAGASY